MASTFKLPTLDLPIKHIQLFLSYYCLVILRYIPGFQYLVLAKFDASIVFDVQQSARFRSFCDGRFTGLLSLQKVAKLEMVKTLDYVIFFTIAASNATGPISAPRLRGERAS